MSEPSFPNSITCRRTRFKKSKLVCSSSTTNLAVSGLSIGSCHSSKNITFNHTSHRNFNSIIWKMHRVHQIFVGFGLLLTTIISISAPLAYHQLQLCRIGVQFNNISRKTARLFGPSGVKSTPGSPVASKYYLIFLNSPKSSSRTYFYIRFFFIHHKISFKSYDRIHSISKLFFIFSLVQILH